MELRDIEYFAVVAEKGSIGRAAEALDMSQPALSKSLRRLEAAMHAKVVRRTPKGVEPTAVGNALLAQARRLRLTLDDISREAADLSEGRSGHLRIGTNLRQAARLVPAARVALSAAAPRVTLKISIEEGNRGAPALARGELDLYITGNPITGYGDIIHEPLYEEEWVVMAGAGHRLARRKRVAVADLANESWVLGLYGPAQQEFLRLLAHHGLVAPRIAVEVNAILFRTRLLPGTDWLTVGPRDLLREDGLRSRVVEIPVRELSKRRTVCACYRKDAYLSPVARRFIDLLKEAAMEIAG
jgi:DNA-binding transcriptional LysR family regulator